MQIEPLAHHHQHLEQIARWHFGQWGHWNPHRTVEVRMRELAEHTASGEIPTTFIALEDGRPLGSASLLEQDLDLRPDLSPWLASVFVAPEHRRRGVGRALVRRVMDEARTLGYEQFYLFTPDRETFYTHLGWRPLARTEQRGDPIVIMYCEFEYDERT